MTINIFKKYPIFLLVPIIILGIVLRFYMLGAIPEGLHTDEAAFGYNSYSIMLTGRDEYGKFLPLVLRSFGDYKAALYSYIDIPFIKIFGLNEFSVRLPTALFGTLWILLVYLIVNQLTKDRRISLLTAALCAISPNLILLSRVQSDPLVAVFFVLLGFYLFLLGKDRRSYIFYVGAFISWVISIFVNTSPRVFLIFFIPLLILSFFKEIEKRQRAFIVIISVLFFIFNLALFKTGINQRYDQLTVFNTPIVQLPLNEEIREDGSNSAITSRIFHNKLVNYGLYLTKNYFDYWNPNFLFSQAESPTRERIQHTGIFYLIELPLFLIGVFALFLKKFKYRFFLISWLIITPAVLSFATDETPNIHRFILGILPFLLIIAYGILTFSSNIKIKSLRLIFGFLITFAYVLSLFYFLHQLFIHQPVHQPWERAHAFKDLSQELNLYRNKYQKIEVTNKTYDPYIFFLFFDKYDPRAYQKSGSFGNADDKGFDKYVFIPQDCVLTAGEHGTNPFKGKTNVLYVNKGSCVDPVYNVNLIKIIKWSDGSDAFHLLEYAPSQQ